MKRKDFPGQIPFINILRPNAFGDSKYLINK